MSIFPKLGPQYYNEEHKGVLERMESFYVESLTINQAFWAEADIDTRFESGDQSVWNDIYGGTPASRQKQFSFNRIRRTVNMVSGHQRKNRKSIVAVPVENGDQETADQFSKIISWADQQEGILSTVSDSFHGALVTGMNLLQVWMDYRQDPISGNIKVDNCSYNSFLIDPYFRKHDLSDCNGIWKRTYVTPREALALLPGKEEELKEVMGNLDNRDGKFEFMPESFNYGTSGLLTYDEYYYRDYRTQKLLVDTQTGESVEWKSDDAEALEQFMRTYPTITIIKNEVPTVKLAIVVQGRVMFDGPNPMGIDSYPFVPVFGYYNPQMPYLPDRIQGMVRGLRDSQYLYNRRKAIELDILESQVTSGFKYKENALVNPKDVFLSGQGRGLALKAEANMTDVEQINPPQIPPSMFELSQSLAREVQEISGVNEELLGSAIDDKAGVLSMLRQGAGLTTLQGLFDNLDRSQKILGKIMIDLIQNNFTPGKVQRIIEAEPSQQFYDKTFGKYDAVIEDGFNTATQRQMQFAQLVQLRELGVEIPSSVILNAATLQNKNELIQAVQQQEQQAAQAEQQAAQVQQQEQQARTELAQARAQADIGLASERVSRIPENRAFAIERLAEANKDRESAVLDKVKALKELEEMDLSHLERLLIIAQQLKVHENQQERVDAVSGSEIL